MLRRPLACALAFVLLAAGATPDADAARRKRGKAPAVPPACTDFHAYANADWLKRHASAPATAAVSAMGELVENARRQQIELLDDAMKAPANEVQKRLGDFWASGLDEAAIERDGAKPIAPLLERIEAIRRDKDLAPAIAALHQVGIPVAFEFGPDIDLQAPDRYIGYFSQGGLGLSDPAYYTRTDADTRAVMTRYEAYVRRILALTGSKANRLEAEARQVVELERRIAQAWRPLSELRDPRAHYARVETASLAKYRNLQLREFLTAQGVQADAVSLADAALFAQLDKLLASVKPAQWKLYLRWRVGDAMAPYLARPFRDASFDFRGRVLLGQAAPPPRPQQVLDAIDLAAGPMLGHEYVARYLAAPQRERAAAIAGQVREQLAAAIARDRRLGDAARTEALAKVARIALEIGAPAQDWDFAMQPMGRGSFGSNMLIASSWRHREAMKRIGRANAARRWEVMPQDPALVYDLAHNRLIVTAAMLQPPVLDAARPLAAQYGAFGALVGHELSHAVDRLGAQVDAGGALRNWWTAQDAAAWNALLGRIAARYDGKPWPGLPGTPVVGARVGEVALADQAGLELAWAAFSAAQPKADDEDRQAFFRGWAGLWAQRLPAAVMAEQAAYGAHPPAPLRTNVPLAQLPAFSEAFGCRPGTPMRPDDDQTVRVWP